ncbi:MAG: MbnP family protein [Bacteroidota bacterium]
MSKTNILLRIKAVKWCFIALVFMVLFFQSCYENIEGCLDVNATNFNVMADRECEDCCEYPLLRLAIQHVYSDPNIDTFYRFNLDSIYTLDSVDYFALTDLKYYLSDIKLIRQNGDTIGVIDRLDFTLISGNNITTQETEDNFALINRSNITPRTLGTIQENGTFVGIQFKLGLSSFDQKVAPEFFESNHPLALGDSSMYDLEEESYIVTRFDLARDTLSMDNDTTTVLILAKDFVEIVELDFDFQVDVGFNTTIALQVDYRRWFEGIDVKNATPETIINLMKTNIRNTNPSPFEVFDVRVSN